MVHAVRHVHEADTEVDPNIEVEKVSSDRTEEQLLEYAIIAKSLVMSTPDTRTGRKFFPYFLSLANLTQDL